jgi:DNA-binding NarL/FixJ family response regulator
MSSDAPIRVLLVDDHQLIRAGVATLLLPESDMKLVGAAANGREATSFGNASRTSCCSKVR